MQLKQKRHLLLLTALHARELSAFVVLQLSVAIPRRLDSTKISQGRLFSIRAFNQVGRGCHGWQVWKKLLQNLEGCQCCPWEGVR